MFERVLTTLRQVAEGLGHPAYGCCSGDPIAWEKDLLRMRAEAAEKAARDAARATTDGLGTGATVPAPTPTP